MTDMIIPAWEERAAVELSKPPEPASIVVQDQVQTQKATVEQLQQQSVQARGDVQSPHVLFWMARAGELLAPWWSRQRDMDLRNFWKATDHLAGAINTFVTRMATVPFHVEPRDMTIKRHIRQAEKMTDQLINESEFHEGWNAYYEPWTEDLNSQDNGAFAEIHGEGDLTGPIIGQSTGISHLDSARCQRTGDLEFPVVFQNPKGERHKLHRSRVMFTSQMQSPIRSMFKVGFCSVSRCVNVSQNLSDILIYKQEKLGSRPLRSIGVTGGGLDPEDVIKALQLAAEIQDNRQLRRYSGTVLIGDANIPEASLTFEDLASMPDGFDERDSTFLGMAVIALAFGVDIRELFPAAVTGATRADAMVSHMKQRGKGYGHHLKLTELLINKFYLPQHLKLVFDFQDDAQDAQVAEIRKTRAETRKVNLQTLITDERTEREEMVHNGDLTSAQFNELELKDGRLEDGTDVLILFHSEDHADLLDLGIDDPIDTVMNDDAEFVLEQIELARSGVIEFMATSENERVRKIGREANAALDALEALYRATRVPLPPAPGEEPVDEGEDGGADIGDTMTMTEEEPGSHDLALETEPEPDGAGNGRALVKLKGEVMSDISNLSDDGDMQMVKDLLEGVAKIKAQTMEAAVRLATALNKDPQVTVEPAQIQVDVHVPEQKAADVNIENVIDVPAPEVQVDVHVPEQEPATINVPAPIVNVEASEVNVEVPAPIVNVEAHVTVPDTEKVLTVERDSMNRIKTIKQISE